MNNVLSYPKRSDKYQIWSCSSQTRNELKRKAKQVVEQVFKLGALTVAQRNEVAAWLVEMRPTHAFDGERMRKSKIPNFVFGGVEFHFDAQKKLDHQVRHGLGLEKRRDTHCTAHDNQTGGTLSQ